MARIGSTFYRDRNVLFVQCVEPMTKLLSSSSYYDRNILEAAIEACEGASMQQIGYEHIPHPMDFGDERYDFVLKVTQENVLALEATDFEWSQEALDLLANFGLFEQNLGEERERVLVSVKRKLKERLEAIRNSLRP